MWKRWLCGLGFVCLLGNAAAEPAVSSLSAALYLPETQEMLWEKDADTKRPMASTTKLMTALLAAEELDLDAEITVPPEAVRVEGSSLGLRGGDRLTVEALLTGMLLESGNDAANTAALAVDGSLEAFSARMNRRAASLHMTHSQFVTPSGLDAEGHGASAGDMALLGAAVLENPALAAICASKTARIAFGDPPVWHTVSNHNRLLSLMPDCIGLKTGYTTRSGRCLVSAARRDGITLVAVTLNGHDYWNDHKELYAYGFGAIKRLTLPAAQLPKLTVSGGNAGTVALSADPPAGPVVKKEAAPTLTVQLRLPAFVLAPVKAGDTVGELCYVEGERIWCRTPILAAETVEARPVASVWAWWRYWLGELIKAWG